MPDWHGIYIDEDVPKEIADALSAEHDVIYVPATEYRGHTDAWHLRQASIERRLLVTYNQSDTIGSFTGSGHPSDCSRPSIPSTPVS